MKKILMICAAGLAVLAAVSCCKNANKVTAIVAGPEQDVIALQIAYEAPVCPESVCPEAFEVEGREVVCAKACPKSGAVTLILKGDCPKAECGEKHECDKPCEKKCGEQPECEKACDKPCEKKCEEPKPCCKEEKAYFWLGGWLFRLCASGIPSAASSTPCSSKGSSFSSSSRSNSLLLREQP